MNTTDKKITALVDGLLAALMGPMKELMLNEANRIIGGGPGVGRAVRSSPRHPRLDPTGQNWVTPNEGQELLGRLDRTPTPKPRGMGAIKDPARRREIALKAVATRRANILAKKRGEAGFKAAETRRKNKLAV